MSPETLPRRHNGEALNPAPIGEVLEVLDLNRFVNNGFDFKNEDLNYLGLRSRLEPKTVAWAIREFGEPCVIESLRRVHGIGVSARYFFGVCRNVLGGESTATGVSATQLPRPHEGGAA